MSSPGTLLPSIFRTVCPDLYAIDTYSTPPTETMDLGDLAPIQRRPNTPADDPSPDAATGPTDIRDKELWFDDGNIVLLAGDGAAGSESTAAFRLYKGILARASPVFSDLFASAQPDDAQGESFDDCPAVRLTDSPLELGHFLRVLFQPGTAYVHRPPHPLHLRAISHRPTRMYRSLRLEYNRRCYPFAELAAIARIAHKYQAETVAADALDRIEQLFLPRPTAKHWVKFVHPWDGSLAKAQVRYKLTLAPEDAVQAVNLAHLFDKPLMLPLALYMCCLLDPLQLRNGVWRKDGTLERLSDEDFVRCINAIPIMTRENCDHLRRILDHANGVQPEGCSDQEKCAKGAKEAVQAFGRYTLSLTDLFLRVDKRAGPHKHFKVDEYLSWACVACRKQHLETSARMCHEAWRNLPQWLGFTDFHEYWLRLREPVGLRYTPGSLAPLAFM